MLLSVEGRTQPILVALRTLGTAQAVEGAMPPAWGPGACSEGTGFMSQELPPGCS